MAVTLDEPGGTAAVEPAPKRERRGAKRRRILPIWSIGALAVLLAVWAADFAQNDPLAGTNPVDRARTLVFDVYQRLHPRAWAGAPVVVVDIDEASLDRVGQWPWSRDRLGRLVDRLREAGAAAVVFDMVFSEPDRTSPGAAITRLRRAGARVEFDGNVEALDNDIAFANSLRGGGVVTGMVFSSDGRRDPPAVPKAGFSYGGTSPVDFLPDEGKVVRNLDVIDEQAAGIGVFTHTPQADGVVRKVPLFFVGGGQVHPSLAVEALRVAQGASSIATRSTDGTGEFDTGDKAVTRVKVGAFEIPTDAAGRMWVWHSPASEKPVVPAHAVLEERGDRLVELVEGRIVLVGTSAAGLLDLRATPLQPVVPGVTIHAEVIDQIMAGQFITRPDTALGYEFAAAIVLGLLAVAVVPFFGSLTHALWTALLISCVLAGSYIAFRDHGLLIGPVVAVAAIAAGYVWATLARLFITERDERFVRSAFGLYLAPALVEELAKDPGQLKLGGEEREVTILFCDIRGFTGLSEGLGPTELTTLLNDFLTPMTRALMARGATIDKYMGDAIMAFWNAPIAQPDHRERAALGVLDMRRELAALNAGRERPIEIGVGLNTGPACVGNLGSEQRFNYSAIGDCVNVSSRVEGLTKQYGLFNLVTRESVAGLEAVLHVEVDRVGVVGRSEPLVVHTLIGEPHEEPEGFDRFLEHHEAFLAAYRAGDLAAAGRAHEAASAIVPADLAQLYTIYRARLDTLNETGLPEGWDGVFRATAK